MSSPSQPTRPKVETQEPITAPQTTSTLISQLVLDPVMVENAWTTIRSFLPPDVKLRNGDAADRRGKENVGPMGKRHDDDGKAEDHAWDFIRGNVERAMLRSRQSRSIDPTAATTAPRTGSQDHLAASNLTNQQPSIDIPTFGPMNEASAPIPTSNLPPVITQKHKTDRTIHERRRQLVEQWVTAQRDKVRERPGYVDSTLQEDRSGSEEGRSMSGVLTSLSDGVRLVARLSSAHGQYRQNGEDEDHTTNVLSASPELISIDDLSSFPQRNVSFDPLADLERGTTVSPRRYSEAVDVSTTGGLDQAASNLTDPALISYGTADTAIISGSSNVRLEDRKLPPTDTHPENHGGKQQSPKTAVDHGKPGIDIENQQNQTTKSEILRSKRMSFGMSSHGGDEKSADDVYLSAEEENPVFEVGAMSSASVPGFGTRKQRMYSFKVGEGFRRTTAWDNIQPGLPASDVQDRNDGVAEPEPKTALDHAEQAFDSANGGDLIDFSSDEEATEGHTPMDDSPSHGSNSGSSSSVSPAEERAEALASDVQEDEAETDGLDTSTFPAAIDGEKLGINLHHEEQPADPAKPGDLDNVSVHATSPPPPSAEANDDHVSTEKLQSNGAISGVPSLAEKRESSGSAANDGQNGAKEDEVKESASAAFNTPATSLNDTPQEKYYFYQSSPTFFLELDPSLPPGERIELEKQLATWSPLSRIHTAKDVLEILQRGSIFRDFVAQDNFLRLRYLEIVGVVITLPFADALRYIVRDLYVTREADEQARQILQEDSTGNHVPAWRLFQGLMLEESRAAFVASWCSGDASIMQADSTFASHVEQLHEHRILDVRTVRSKIACMLDHAASCDIEELCQFVVIFCSPPFLVEHFGTCLIEKFLGGLRDICGSGHHSATERSLLKAVIQHCEGVETKRGRSIVRPESEPSNLSDGSADGNIDVVTAELVGDTSSTTEHAATQGESQLHSNGGASVDKPLTDDRTTKDAVNADEALQDDHTTKNNADDDKAASEGEMHQDPQPKEHARAEEGASPKPKYVFYVSSNNSQSESYPQVTPLARSLLDKSEPQVTATNLYSLLLEAPADRQFATLEAFCKDPAVTFSKISTEIPLGSAWRYFLRGLCVAYKPRTGTFVYHRKAWPFLQSLLLAEKRVEFMSPWSDGSAVEEQVERLLSRGSGFVSDICRLYDAHFVIASDVETMIMESLSHRSTAAGVKELCYLFVLYTMRPRRGVMPYHASDSCATNCLRSLEKATGEEELPKALRDLCRAVVKFGATVACATA